MIKLFSFGLKCTLQYDSNEARKNLAIKLVMCCSNHVKEKQKTRMFPYI